MVEITKVALDKIDRKILAELDKNCRIPISTLAKKVRKSRQAVEYRINNLVKKGIITNFYITINPHKLGYRVYRTYFKLKNIPDRKRSLLEDLRSSGITSWVNECAGSWDLIFETFSKTRKIGSLYRYFEFKNEILSKYHDLIIYEHGDNLIDVRVFPKMFFVNETGSPTFSGGEVSTPNVDDLDYSILNKLLANARVPVNTLAKEIKSTPSTVRSRMRKLEKEGILVQYRIWVDLNKLGLGLIKAIIKVDKYSKQDEKRLYEYVSKLPNLMSYLRNIWEIELDLVVNTYQEFYQIIGDLKEKFPFFIRTVDSVMVTRYKRSHGVKNALK